MQTDQTCFATIADRIERMQVRLAADKEALLASLARIEDDLLKLFKGHEYGLAAKIQYEFGSRGPRFRHAIVWVMYDGMFPPEMKKLIESEAVSGMRHGNLVFDYWRDFVAGMGLYFKEV